MQSGRLGLVTLITAAALWAQLVLIPLAAARGEGLVPAALSTALLALAVAGTGVGIAPRRPAVGVALVLAGFPASLALVALVAGSHPLARFDAAARVIAAGTAVAFVGAALAWAQSLQPALPVSVAALDPLPERTAPPPLRGAAMTLLALVASFLAVVAPALVTARSAASRTDRLGGEGLVHAREALTAAGGLVLGLALVLGAGSALLRGRAARRRRGTRALAFLLWSVAVVGLKMLLERLR
jgi:hypothetical protein